LAACIGLLASRVDAEIILSWNTFGNLGTETTEPSVFNDPSFANANLTLGGGLTPAANGNRFGGSGWFDTGNTGAGNTIAESVAGNNYIQFVVTPTGGASFSATSFVFGFDRSATGPSSVTLRSSFDNFSSDLGAFTVAATQTNGNTINISGLNNLSTAITFRLYGTGATGTGGTGGFDTGSDARNVVFNGTITAVTEPTSLALLGMAGCTGLVTAYRRRKSKKIATV